LIHLSFILTTLLPAIIIAYLLGAIPVASMISRRSGVDIFSVGTGLAGASNVRRHVGNFRGLLAGLFDLTKGLVALLIGRLLGIDDAWIVLPALAAIAGHWNSVFTRFRGGDGLSILAGIMIGMFPDYGVIGVLVALVVALGGQKLPYTSLLSVVFGYGTVAALVLSTNGELPLALGLGGLSALVLARASLGHHRRRDNGLEWDDLEDVDGAADPRGFS